MDQQSSDLLTVLVSCLAYQGGGASPLQCAQELGWVDAEGELTSEGQAVAMTFSQENVTERVFRTY